MDASIVVVSYNTKELTLSCLASIREHTARLAYETIVVDNASTDGSADAIAQAYPWVTLRRAPGNLGFSGGVNDGLSVSRGEFIILFNSDAFLIDNAFLAMLEYARAHPRVGAVGCRVMNEDRSHQPTAGRFPDLWLDFSDHVLRPLRVLPRRWRLNCIDAEDHRVPVDVDWLSGSCALYRRAALDMAGGIDEDFFLGEEDIDLGYRLKQAGWRVVYLPFSGVVHFGGRSRALSPDAARHFFNGRYLFYKKHRSPRYARAFRALLLAAYGVRRLAARVRAALGAGSASSETLTRYEQYWQAARRCE